MPEQYGQPMHTLLTFVCGNCGETDEHRRIRSLPDAPDGSYRALWKCPVCNTEFEGPDARTAPLGESTIFRNV